MGHSSGEQHAAGAVVVDEEYERVIECDGVSATTREASCSDGALLVDADYAPVLNAVTGYCSAPGTKPLFGIMCPTTVLRLSA
jgi:hypothetical protein